MKTILLIALTLSLTAPALAHEGHQKTPGGVAAPHGGVTQGTDSLYWELVTGPDGVALYPLTHDLALIAPKEIVLNGKVSFPKKPKSVAVTFAMQTDHFAARIDAKGAYRYTLDLTFTYQGKKEKVKFQVEPQS